MRGFFDRHEMALAIAAPATAVAVFELLGFVPWERLFPEATTAFRPDWAHAAALGLILALGRIAVRRRHESGTAGDEAPGHADAPHALRESEARLRAIYENAGTGILLASPLGDIISANRAFQGLVGYDEEELRRIGWQSLIHPEDGRTPNGKSAPHDRGHAIGNAIERQFVRKNGQAIWVKLTASYAFDDGGRPTLSIVVAEDVSARHEAENLLQHANEELERRVEARMQDLRAEIAERVKAQEALGESEKKFRALIENAHDFVLVLGRDGVIQYLSPSIHTTMGFREDDLVGKSAFEGIHPSDVERVRDSFERLAGAPDASDSMQFRVRDARGQWRVVEANSRNLLHNPMIGGIVVNSRDVTDRYQAEESARNRENELAHIARVSTIGEMAAGFAHELNQPLTAIQNYAAGCVRRLKRGAPDPDQLGGAMEAVVEQSQRASEIIRRIRWFVRRDVPEMTPVDINAVIREAMELVKSDAHHAGVSVRFDLANNLPWARADTTQIQQVVINVARNGFEAMSENRPDRRELLLRTRALSPREIEVSILDSGSGIPGDVHERLFDPFFTTKSGGMGMGLSICRTIIERHDGRIYVGRSGDHGTEIHFTLQAFDNVVPLARGGNDSAGTVDPDPGHTFN